MLHAARSYGPIRLKRLQVGPGVAVHPSGYVDLGLLRGTLVLVPFRTACILLGVYKKTLRYLIEVGAVGQSDELSCHGVRYVKIDPGATLEDIYRDWVKAQGTFHTHAQFSVHRRLRKVLHLGSEVAFPEPVLEGVFQRLLEIGSFNRNEILAFLPILDRDEITVRAWMATRLSDFCSRRPTSAGVEVTLEMFRKMVPESIACAPRTRFDPNPTIGLQREAPSQRIRSRLWELHEFAACGSLYALITAPRLRRPDQLREHVLAIETMEEVMRTYAPDRRWTAAVYEQAMRAYALDRTIRPQDRPHVRDLTIRLWRMVVFRLHAYVRQVDPDGKRGLRQFLPPIVRVSLQLRNDMQEKYGNLRAEGRAARKARSWLALRELDDILDAARNRRDEMRAFGEAMRIEEDAFCAHELKRPFKVPVPILDERGRLIGGEQEVRFMLWRTVAAKASLEREDASERLASYLRVRPGRKPLDLPPFTVEYLGTDGVDGATPRTPWMVEFDRLCVTHAFSSATDEAKEERHAAIRDLKLCGSHSGHVGLLGFEQERAGLKRNGLLAGRHFFALQEIEHAMRLAFHQLDCVSQSFNRPHEVAQQTMGGWERLPWDGDEPWFKLNIYPKVNKRSDLASVIKVPLCVCETTMNEALDIGELEMRRLGVTEFPTVAPEETFAWKLPPAKYICSRAGRIVGRQSIRNFLRYLLAGWPPFSLHDFRHVMAEDCALDNVAPAIIAMLLSDTLPLAKYYSRLPQWAKDIVDAENLERRLLWQDRRLKSLEDAA